jgi:hypothetical protein
LILLANLILIALVFTPLPGAIDGVIARLGLALIAVLLLVGVLRFWPVGRADQYMDE